MTPVEQPPAEAYDAGPAAQVPVFEISPETNRVRVTWPEPRPEHVLITAEGLDQIVQMHNDMVDQIDRQRAVLTIVRLGRRPNKADWASVGMATDQAVRIDLEARREQ